MVGNGVGAAGWNYGGYRVCLNEADLTPNWIRGETLARTLRRSCPGCYDLCIRDLEYSLL